MDNKFLYNICNPKPERFNTRKKLFSGKLVFFFNGISDPAFSVDTKVYDSLSKIKSFLVTSGRAELYLKLSMCTLYDYDSTYNREPQAYKSFIKINDVWYILPSDVAWRVGTENTRLVNLNERAYPVSVSYYDRDMTNYGRCPVCGNGVTSGIGGTDMTCRRCKQPLKWRN